MIDACALNAQPNMSVSSCLHPVVGAEFMLFILVMSVLITYDKSGFMMAGICFGMNVLDFILVFCNVRFTRVNKTFTSMWWQPPISCLFFTFHLVTVVCHSTFFR